MQGDSYPREVSVSFMMDSRDKIFGDHTREELIFKIFEALL
jgi:hypothetical protein